MQNHNKKDQIIEIISIVMGDLIIAAGVTFFILPLDILSGGMAGIAATLQPILNLSPRLVINGLTVGLYLLGTALLGKCFASKTVVSTIVYPLFTSILGMLWSDVQVTSNPLLASIYVGACTGIGIGLVYRTGDSTEGMDIPSLITNKYTKIALPTLVMCIGGATVFLGVSVYGVEAAIIGLVSVWVYGQLIDKVITMGSHEAKNVMIISGKFEEMMQVIYQNINRDVTTLHAGDGYTRTNKSVIMMVMVKKQFSELNHTITKVDPEAFVIVSDVDEVQGEGFTYQEQL